MTTQTQNFTPVTQKLFGTDGVRGVANVEPVTAETALKLGRAAAHVFKKEGGRRHRIVVGKDTRLSGYMLENAISAGILSMGVDVLLIGPLPTPGVAYITRSLRADAGIVLTASHNPYEDNGIKFFRKDGYKLDNAIEEEIERLVFSGEIDTIRPTATAIGKAYRIDDALGRYIEFVKNSFPKGMTLDGYRIVVDAANGAGYKSAPCVLRELGADVIALNISPDGTNINHHCGSMHMNGLRQAIIEHKAHLGIAHDGDADRLILCDEDARITDGDDVLAILGTDYLKRDLLHNNTLVATVMSNMGLDAVIKHAGGKVVRSPVGDRFVIEEMIKVNSNLGGEQSGHIICRDYTTTGDGIISALQVLRIMRTTGKSLSQLSRIMKRFPQVTVNIRVKEKPPIESMPDVMEMLNKVQDSMAGNGRVLLRYSGTEPMIRLLLEGEDSDQIENDAQKLSKLLRNKIGA